MSYDVVCLRPEADFARAGVAVPPPLRVAYRAPDDADVDALLHAARALVIPAVGPKLAPERFEGARLALVQVTGAGVDRLDQPALTRLAIPVANVPGGSNAAVAEYAVTTAATLLRRLAWSDAEIRAGRYAAARARLVADNVGGLEGLLVGIVGLGVIGLAVAEAFRRAGARIAYYDPAPRAAPAEMAPMSLEDLLHAADVVSLHVPLLPNTRNLLDARALASMKRDAVLVNAARGGVVDERALAEALDAGRLGGAAVDVYSTEPPGTDNPLLALQGDGARRLLLTPHIAGVTRQSSAFLFREAWNNVERVLVRGEPPRHRVY